MLTKNRFVDFESSVGCHGKVVGTPSYESVSPDLNHGPGTQQIAHTATHLPFGLVDK